MRYETVRGQIESIGDKLDHHRTRLLEVLVCPVTRGRLTYDRERNELVSAGAKLAFPIRDGVPIMLAEDARPLD